MKVIVAVLIVCLIFFILYLYSKRCKCGEHRKLKTWTELWTDHLLYTRLVVLAIENDSPNTSELLARLMKNQSDISKMFGKDAPIVEKLLVEHITLAGNAVTDVKTGSKTLDKDLENLYANAEKIGMYLDIVAPSGGPLFVHHMKMHIDTLVKMVVANHKKDYVSDVANLDYYTKAGLEMAFDIAKYYQ